MPDNKVALWQLRQRQGLPFEIKEGLTANRIRSWYEHWNGEVYVSFSGGKDSTVLLDMVRKIYPKVVAVFCDTGMEYPQIRDFVKTIDNVVWLKPKTPFPQVIKKHGFPIISKEISRTIEYGRKGSPWAIKRLNGDHNYGNHKKYKYLLDAPFKISDMCCDVMKKKPFKEFEKETGLHPMIGTMASEGGQRESAYKRVGCSSFGSPRPKSTPIAFWMEQDIWDYLKTYNIPYSKIYDMGFLRTGCMWCGFGIHMEKGENKFQRMARQHPAQYSFCINKLGFGEVLDFIGIDYKTRSITLDEMIKTESEKNGLN